MAERATEIEAARSLYQKAALLIDRGESPEPEAGELRVFFGQRGERFSRGRKTRVRSPRPGVPRRRFGLGGGSRVTREGADVGYHEGLQARAEGSDDVFAA
jgi:hypothetical protein